MVYGIYKCHHVIYKCHYFAAGLVDLNAQRVGESDIPSDIPSDIGCRMRYRNIRQTIRQSPTESDKRLKNPRISANLNPTESDTTSCVPSDKIIRQTPSIGVVGFVGWGVSGLGDDKK